MSQEIGKIAVALSLEDEGFNTSITGVNRSLKTLGAELTAMKAKGSTWGNSIEGLTQRQSALGRTLQVQKTKVEQLRQRYQESAAATGEYSAESQRLATLLNRAVGELNRTEAELGDVTAALNRQQAELERSQSKWTKLGDTMTKAGSKLKSVGQGMQNVGSTMSLAITAPLTAIGVTAVKTAADFEAQMSRVAAIAGATDKEFEQLRKSALELGASTSKSASEVAIAQENLAALGFTATDIIAAMPGVISAAEASGADMAQTAEVMASALNIFGLEASESTRVADVLAQTANQSAADIGDMAYALKYAGPVAANLGVSLEELSASIGIMTDSGLDGSSAGTALRAGLLALLKPSEQNSKKMDALGISMTDANGKFVGLEGVIASLSSSMEGMTDAQKTATLASLVGTEASSGFLALMKAGPEEINKMTTALENSGGASEETAKKMKQNLNGTLEELGGAMQTLQITIGNALAPTIAALAEQLQKLAQWFTNLSPEVQKTVLVFAAIAAAIGPLLVVFGVLASAIGSIMTVFGTLSTAIAAAGGASAAFGAVIAAVTGPIGLTIAAIAALIAAGVLLYKNWDTISAYASKAWAATKEVFASAVSSISSATLSGFNSAVSGLKNLWNSMIGFFTTLWSNVKSIFSTAVSGIVSFVNERFGFMISAVKTIFDNLVNIFKNVWVIIKNVFLGALLMIVNLVTGDFESMRSQATQIMNNLKTALSNIWNSIKTMVSTTVEALKQAAINAFNNLKNGAVNAVTATKNGVVNGFNAARDLAISTVGKLKDSVVKTFNSLKESIATAMDNVKKAIEDGWNKAKSFLDGIDLSTIGRDIVQGLINGIKGKFEDVKKAASELAEKVKGAIKGALDINSPSRVTTQYGKWTGEGMANGISKSSKKAEAQAKAMAKSVSEAIKNAEVKFDTNKISADQYIATLKKIDAQHKLTGEQSRKIQTEINAVMKQKAKEAAAEAKAAETFYQKLDKINDDYVAKVKATRDQLKETEQKLTDEYKKQLADRKAALMNFASIFDEVTPKDVSGEQLISNLGTQVDALRQYENSINALKGRGLSQTLLEELESQGPKAAAEIAALASLNDAQLAEYQRLYNEKARIAAIQASKEMVEEKAELARKIEAERKKAEQTVLSYKNEWLKQINALKAETLKEMGALTPGMQNAGKNAIKGMIDGMKAMKGPLMEEAQALAAAVEKTIKSALKIKSPSRLMRDEVGKMIPAGVAVGIEGNMGVVAKAAQALSRVASSSHMGNVAQQATRNYNNSAVINVYSPSANPVEIARTQRQEQRRLAAEWGV